MRIETAADYRKAVSRLRLQLGPKYWPLTFGNYEIYDAAQRPVVDRLLRFAADMPRLLSGGGGLILFGQKGTGKDHLVSALLKLALVKHRFKAEWYDGGDLRNKLADAACQGTIAELEQQLLCSHILAISDPVPPKGELTAPILWRLRDVIDRRYRKMKSTWITTNVDRPEDAEMVLTGPVLDRIKEGSGQVFCDWPSHRERVEAAW